MRCSFCNTEIKQNKVLMYFYANGKTLVFCSSKCKKYMLKLKKDPKKLKWVNING